MPTVDKVDVAKEDESLPLENEESLIELKERKIKSIQSENERIKSDEKDEKASEKEDEYELGESFAAHDGAAPSARDSGAREMLEAKDQPALLTMSDLNRLATSLVPLSIDDRKAQIEDLKIEDMVIESKMSIATGRIDKMDIDPKAYNDAVEMYEQLRKDFEKAIADAETAVANLEVFDGDDEKAKETLEVAKDAEHEVRVNYESAIRKAQKAVRQFERMESMGVDDEGESSGNTSDTDELPYGDHITFEELTGLIKDTKKCSQKAAEGAALEVVASCPEFDGGAYITMHVYESLMAMSEELENVEEFFEEDA